MESGGMTKSRSRSEEKARVVVATTSPLALWNFFRAQARHLGEAGFEVHAVSAPGELLERFHRETGVPVHAVAWRRQVAPGADLLALARILALLLRLRPAIVQTHTPKAGLLGMIASRLAGVPRRIYTINGLVLATRRGWRRLLLAAAERISCRLATEVLAVSPSLAAEVAALGLCAPGKLRTLGHGGSHGVDLERFDPARWRGARERTRDRLEIPRDAAVIGYVGRVVRDKGIGDLAAAWRRLRETHPGARLVVCGDFEEHGAIEAGVRAALESDARVHITREAAAGMPAVYAALDVLVLPTYREGLPNVALEAAAMELPVVATRVAGCVDAIADGETGLLVAPGDVEALASALARAIDDAGLRARLGRRARRLVAERFEERAVSARLVAMYRAAGPRSAGAPGLQAGHRFAAALALVALAPVMALTALAVAIFVGRPVLFRQERGGLGGRVFQVYKFRTMTGDRDANGRLLADENRMTRVGRFLRSASLDELPQLFNVLRGEMSLVGPRPLHSRYLDRYDEFQRRRHEVRPGITGWAQVHGRNAISWDEKFALDVWYVDNRSFLLDLRILWKTALKVLRREGVAQASCATMPEFVGSDHKSNANQTGVPHAC
jgi:lipopolysaccharide/colanic/teichoic acid biosynthesis glycosyltransferase/glycosyltransferase involved in cell wall biosynthesis